MNQVHHYSDTGAAYSATQHDATVMNGDVLVIVDERVIGMAETWPFAITVEPGSLHQLDPTVATIKVLASAFDLSEDDTRAALARAVDIADVLGYPVAPTARKIAEGQA